MKPFLKRSVIRQEGVSKEQGVLRKKKKTKRGEALSIDRLCKLQGRLHWRSNCQAWSMRHFYCMYPPLLFSRLHGFKAESCVKYQKALLHSDMPQVVFHNLSFHIYIPKRSRCIIKWILQCNLSMKQDRVNYCQDGNRNTLPNTYTAIETWPRSL